MDWSQRIGRRLKPRDLHIFLAVAEHGSMAKAAQSLAISRPVVSKTIADLEETLGVRLLDRTSNGVEPTQFGRALMKRSLAVFDELRQSVKEIEFLADPNAGELSIGFSEVPAAGLVPAALDELSRQYPRLSVRTEQGDVTTVLDLLRSRRCELAVIRPLAPEPDLAIEPICHDRLFVAVGAQSKWARRRKVRLVELLDEPWILSRPEIQSGSPVFEAFHGIGAAVPRVVVSGSLNLRYGLLATGRFVTLIPGSALYYGVRRAPIQVLPIEIPRWSLPLSVVTLKHRTLSPIGQLFIGCLHDLAKVLQRDTSPGTFRRMGSRAYRGRTVK
jgi:DNA-binding transcriptional LysR family regulator